MKKNILAYCLLLVTIFISGCVVNSNTETVFRRQLIVESNLSKFQINITTFDSTKIYPYVLRDIIDTNIGGSEIFRIQPVQDTGFIKFKIFGGKGEFGTDIPLSFKDSLTIITPIDTTLISINTFSFN